MTKILLRQHVIEWFKLFRKDSDIRKSNVTKIKKRTSMTKILLLQHVIERFKLFRKDCDIRKSNVTKIKKGTSMTQILLRGMSLNGSNFFSFLIKLKGWKTVLGCKEIIFDSLMHFFVINKSYVPLNQFVTNQIQICSILYFPKRIILTCLMISVILISTKKTLKLFLHPAL